MRVCTYGRVTADERRKRSPVETLIASGIKQEKYKEARQRLTVEAKPVNVPQGEVVSSRGSNVLVEESFEDLSGGVVAETGAWAFVEFAGDGVEVGLV